MAASSSARLKALLAPVVAAAGLELETLDVTPAGKRRIVRVVVDADAGVTLDAVAEVSRAISDALDTTDVPGAGPFVLEVSSPGVDRPLTEPKHWRRAAGRLVTVNLVDGSTRSGRVVAADAVIVMELAGQLVELAWADVRRGRVEVEFSRLATQPEGGEVPGGGDDADEPDQGGAAAEAE